MNLVKWFRKYNKKVMAVVVIVIMFGFIGGGTLLQQLSKRRVGALAHFGEKNQISDYDLLLARRELEIMRMLRADALLRSQDLHGVFLGELLFSDQRASPALINRIKQSIRTNQYRISEKQINDIYRRQVPPGVYWLLLENEAQLAGIRISNAQVGELLGKVIPQLFEGQTYSQLIGAIIRQQRIPEQQILTTLGKLLAVLQYSSIVCSNEDLTTRQITQAASTEEERVNVEFVKFDTAVFAEKQDEPGADKIAEHFNKYKAIAPGTVNDENPHGFGYKLPDRVQLEYIAVKLDEVKTIVKRPTQDELGDYYNRNKELLFTEEVPSDPNDPNSPPLKKTKSYAEVANSISQQLLKDKINSTAQNILQEARTLTEANLENLEIESAKVTTEQLKEKAGDYKTAAAQLSEKYKIKVYTGQTGLLSPIDMQSDEKIATLFLQGYGQNPVRLSKVVFAVDELAVSELGPFDVPKPRMFENIGPVKDIMSMYSSASGGIMAIIRVIDAKKAAEPESIDQTYSISSLKFDPNEEKPGEDIYSVKEKITEDLKKLAVLDTTKSKAEEFVALAKKDGWTSAINKFEELYGQLQQRDPNEPNAFRLQNYPDMRRISKANLETLALQSQGDPMALFYLNESKVNQQFVDQLYSLVPQDNDTAGTLPLVMEFKPDLSFYVIKNISVKRFFKEDFDKMKATRLFREDYTQSQSLAVIHFNPENILKRMNFKPAKSEEEPADANKPAKSEAAS
ncbi:MAG: hypothetical protein A2Z38_09295 [Planctomycetes bacterium RBG_19FT_COMBO_48_8]|nr:MAG: hypothetical protein A2Z38_09295 [Planctomycetes bacterium RBG_19FT_COMBO_48_8]